MIAKAKPGLTRLDEVREASMADEGGSSGAWMESEELDEKEPVLVRRSFFSKKLTLSEPSKSAESKPGQRGPRKKAA